MTLDKFLCWISMCWTFLNGPGYWSSTNSHPFWRSNSFEVPLLCLAPHPSWLQELQHQPVTCELGLPRHWSYRHGRWRRIDGCQDIMLSLTTINYYLLFIGISATTTATMIVIISIYFLFLLSFLLQYVILCFPFFFSISSFFPIVIVNISILIISILRFSLGDFLYEQNMVWPSYVIVGLFMQHNRSTPRHQLLQEAPWWRLMLGVASRDKKDRAWDIKKWSYSVVWSPTSIL